MEAVPKLPMIYFELKISPVCPDFETPFKSVSVTQLLHSLYLIIANLLSFIVSSFQNTIQKTEIHTIEKFGNWKLSEM